MWHQKGNCIVGLQVKKKKNTLSEKFLTRKKLWLKFPFFFLVNKPVQMHNIYTICYIVITYNVVYF